jgi:hypothetical protein
MVLGAGLEQVTAGSAGNTYAARIGTVVLSGTLASDAAAGTAVLTADVTGGHPYITTSDVDFNLISASGVRATGVARAWIVIQEGNRPQGRPKAAARDATTGLS